MDVEERAERERQVLRQAGRYVERSNTLNGACYRLNLAGRNLRRVSWRELRPDWRSWLWLIPALILLAALASNYPGMRESWGLGGPGARHAEDVERAREMQDLFGAPHRLASAR